MSKERTNEAISAVGVSETLAKNEAPQVVCVAVDGAVDNVAEVAEEVACGSLCSTVCVEAAVYKRYKYLPEDKIIHVDIDEKALFEKAILRPDEKQFKVLVNKIKEKLKVFKSFVKNGKASEYSEEEFLEFCGLIAEYCRVTRHISSITELPKICIDYECPDSAGAYCGDGGNFIAINSNYVSRWSLCDLVTMIGHEMEHCHQHSAASEFDKKSNLAVHLLTEAEKTSLNSIKKYRNPDEEKCRLAHEKFMPYIKSTELPEGYKDFDEFFKEISYAAYHTNLSEQEARKEGYDFKLQFAKKFSLLDYFVSVHPFVYFSTKASNKMENIKAEKTLKTMLDYYSVDNESLIKIAKDCTTDNKGFGSVYNIIAVLLRDKKIDELIELLKKAVSDSCYNLVAILQDLIMKDVEFKSKKSIISKAVAKCFISSNLPKNENNYELLRDNLSNFREWCGDLLEVKDSHYIMKGLYDNIQPGMFIRLVEWFTADDYIKDLYFKAQDRLRSNTTEDNVAGV